MTNAPSSRPALKIRLKTMPPYWRRPCSACEPRTPARRQAAARMLCVMLSRPRLTSPPAATPSTRCWPPCCATATRLPPRRLQAPRPPQWRPPLPDRSLRRLLRRRPRSSPRLRESCRLRKAPRPAASTCSSTRSSAWWRAWPRCRGASGTSSSDRRSCSRKSRRSSTAAMLMRSAGIC